MPSRLRIICRSGGDDDINGSGRKKMWATLKTKFPKISKPTLVAKKDKSGKLISNHEDLRKLYLKTYI